MPNIKSAKKRVRVSRTTTENNKTTAVRAAIQKIDQAVSKGIMHKNTAARRKSAIVRKSVI